MLSLSLLFIVSVAAQRIIHTQDTAIVIDAAPEQPADLSHQMQTPDDFSRTQKKIYHFAEDFYNYARSLKPHAHNSRHTYCKVHDPARPLHLVCLVDAQPMQTTTYDRVGETVEFLKRKYPNGGREGGIVVNSFFPTPDFVQKGTVRFEAGVKKGAVFWNVDHGLGCLDGNRDKWCVTVLIKDVEANGKMQHLLRDAQRRGNNIRNIKPHQQQ